MNKLNIYNKISGYNKSFKDIKRILKYLSKEMNQQLSASIHICDSKEIRKLNKEHRDKDSSTDVLSFPHNEFEGKHLYIGDIFINKDIIVKQAKEIESDPITELTFLAMHGLLHLIGYDHINNKLEEEMTAKQREIFINLKIREW